MKHVDPFWKRASFLNTVVLILAALFLIQLIFVDRLNWPGTLVPLNFPWTGLALLTAAVIARRYVERERQQRPQVDAVLIFLVSLFFFLSNFRWHGMDDFPTSLLPFTILRSGSLYLDTYKDLFVGLVHDNIVQAGKHWVSFYPITGAILALPVYALPVWLGVPPRDHDLHQLEKMSASLICAGAVTVLYLVYRRRLSPRDSAILALLYAFGTSIFSLACQALWQYGPCALCLLLALWSMERTEDSKSHWTYCGFFAVMAVAARSTGVFYAAAFFALSFLLDGAPGWRRFIYGALPAGLLCELYWWGIVGTGMPAEISFQHGLLAWPPKLEALAGLLISPGRGVFLYSPVGVFAIAGLVRAIRQGTDRRRIQAIALGTAVCGNLFLLTCYTAWSGVMAAFGPRYLLEALTVVSIFLPDVWSSIHEKPLVRRLWQTASCWSILCHATGAYFNWDLTRIDFPVTPWDLITHPFVAKFLYLIGHGIER